MPSRRLATHIFNRQTKQWRPMTTFAYLPAGEIIGALTCYRDGILAVAESGRVFRINRKGRVREVKA